MFVICDFRHLTTCPRWNNLWNSTLELGLTMKTLLKFTSMLCMRRRMHIYRWLCVRLYRKAPFRPVVLPSQLTVSVRSRRAPPLRRELAMRPASDGQRRRCEFEVLHSVPWHLCRIIINVRLIHSSRGWWRRAGRNLSGNVLVKNVSTAPRSLISCLNACNKGKKHHHHNHHNRRRHHHHHHHHPQHHHLCLSLCPTSTLLSESEVTLAPTETETHAHTHTHTM